MDSQENNNHPRQLVEASSNDQRFLINFIMGTFLGPDVKTDIPRRSAAQRMAEGLPPYSLNDLGSSFVSLPQVENLYYYILRHAHPSAVLKLHSLYMYFKGKLSSPWSGLLEDSQQFTSFFPLNLHKQTRYRGSHKVNGTILIDNPDTSYIKLEDLEKFRHLTGMYDIKINIGEVQLYSHGYRTDKEESNQDKMSKETEIKGVLSGSASATAKHQVGMKKRSHTDPFQMDTLPQLCPIPIQAHPIEESFSIRTSELGGPSMVSLFSTPKLEQCNSNSSIILTGTAKEGRAGPPVGLVDIGISKDAYLFRVALPGVKKDQGQFSCEIEHNGKVHIRGVMATGERSVLRHSRLFQMKTQHLCPPGPFTVSFSLPGPVDPRLFSPDFRSDGILEAVVMKYKIPGA
ncbi:increased DNA methylation 3 [Telopea speciosissima]|uniref:increased DNA methylation 3 n=1 Tax=Telopea speciosissima TaxID=54955 RepID=UPI001CC70785|nr:increased DNA methylation 3 [Telopea speciosissima]XP_043707879.1 increased DNA methylation 3 [Telopea speciosissima]XP_043707880.1 increased DNA methylation 3 [Telopea speciosissima]XP_043707881.1 increased DNA methylation 3 [Telopea speciosissima]